MTLEEQAAWTALDRALGQAADRMGRPLRLWLRDDDAVDATPPLARLVRACEGAAMPLLLAVIPAGATAALPAWLAGHPLVTPCQHGLAHCNHAAAGERACELGGARDDATVLAELREGRALLRARFGAARLSPVLVPPWNRIRPSLLPALPACGFAALSAFAGATPPAPAALPRLDCDIDIIDWRNGRRGRTLPDLCRRLEEAIAGAAPEDRPVGLLTHHLAHDAAAWRFVERALPWAAAHPAIRLTDAATELGRATRAA